MAPRRRPVITRWPIRCQGTVEAGISYAPHGCRRLRDRDGVCLPQGGQRVGGYAASDTNAPGAPIRGWCSHSLVVGRVSWHLARPAVRTAGGSSRRSAPLAFCVPLVPSGFSARDGPAVILTRFPAALIRALVRPVKLRKRGGGYSHQRARLLATQKKRSGVSRPARAGGRRRLRAHSR